MALRRPKRDAGNKPVDGSPAANSPSPDSPRKADTAKMPDTDGQQNKAADKGGAWLTDGESHRLGSRMTSVLLSSIKQDPENSRTRFISVGLRRRMTKLFQEKSLADPENVQLTAEDLQEYVGIAKSDSPDTPEREIEKTILDIWELASHLKHNDLLQPFAITADGKGGNNIVFGNVRFISMCIAHGEQASIECLQYPSKPSYVGVKRFIENNARNDVPLSGKLRDLSIALEEIEKSSPGAPQTKIANQLGMSRSQYYLYRDVIKDSSVLSLISAGKIGTLEFGQKLSKYKQRDLPAKQAALNAVAAQNEPLTDFEKFIKGLDEGGQTKKEKSPPKAKGRPSKIKIPAIDEPVRLKEILAPTVLEMDGWKEVDWNDTSKENVNKIEGLIKKLLQPKAK